MSLSLPRLYAIVDRGTLDTRGLDLAAFVEELAEAGVRLLQYRDKSGSPQRILRAAATIAQVMRDRECVLVMNDRSDLAWMAGWPGVHVGQNDLPPAAVRRVLCGEGAGVQVQGAAEVRRCVVGISTHNDEQVRSADASSADYIAVGPVFPTGSKADADPAVGLEGVRQARALTRKPLVAIGGVTAANATSVMSVGADSVAVIGALLPADGLTTKQRAEALLKALESA